MDSDYAPLIEFESAVDFFNFFEQSSQVYIKNGVENLVIIFVDDTFVDVFEVRRVLDCTVITSEQIDSHIIS